MNTWEEYHWAIYHQGLIQVKGLNPKIQMFSDT